MRCFISAFVLCLGLGIALTGEAKAAEETPTQLDGVTVVSPEQLLPLLDQGVAVYDLRKKASYADGHLPGAKSAADYYNSTDTTMDTSFLSANKKNGVVFYSHGSTGWKSYWAAQRAVEAGYTNVMWLRDGFAAWAAGDYPVSR
jgi:rhodanese-related sulfurtransferase